MSRFIFLGMSLLLLAACAARVHGLPAEQWHAMSPQEQQLHVAHRQQLAQAREERRKAEQRAAAERQRQQQAQQQEQQALALAAQIQALEPGTHYLILSFLSGRYHTVMAHDMNAVQFLLVKDQWQQTRFSAKSSNIFDVEVGFYFDGQRLWLDADNPDNPSEGAEPLFVSPDWYQGALLQVDTETKHRFTDLKLQVIYDVRD